MHEIDGVSWIPRAFSFVAKQIVCVCIFLVEHFSVFRRMRARRRGGNVLAIFATKTRCIVWKTSPISYRMNSRTLTKLLADVFRTPMDCVLCPTDTVSEIVGVSRCSALSVNTV